MTDFGTAQFGVTNPDTGWWQDVNNLTYRTFPAFAGQTASQIQLVNNSLASRGVCVTDPPYGAACDGVTDDTAAWQGCINANPGKTIIFPPLRSLITSPLTINNGAFIQGTRYRSTFVLGTQNQNGLLFGDGTSGTRNSASEGGIDSVAFNVKPGLAAFTSGSCITRNNVYDVHVNNCDFYGYDSSTSSTKLWVAVTDIAVQESNSINCTYNYLLGGVLQLSGLAGNLSSDNFYDYFQFENIFADAIQIGNYVSGITFRTPTCYTSSGWAFNINSGTGNNGQNIFIFTPDIECDGTGSGIWVQQANGVQVCDGWMGKNSSTNPVLVHFGLNASNCSVNNTNLYGGQVLIEGPENSLGGGSFNGDTVNNPVGIKIAGTAEGTSINPMRIGQFTQAGIQFTSTPPAPQCRITGVTFKDINSAAGGIGYEVVGSIGALGSILGTGGSSAGLPPAIRDCISDAPYNFNAAGTGAITASVGRSVIQVTASANITSITNLSDGSRLTIQAGTGGLTFASGGNIYLSASPLTIAAFAMVSFVNWGNLWFVDGRSV